MTLDMSDRNAAWAAVHDPATDAAALAAIAQTYPEFGPTISVHPNCYDALSEWIGAAAIVVPPMPTAPAQPVTPAPTPMASPGPTDVPTMALGSPDAAASRPRKRRGLVIGLSVAAGLVVIGGSVTWAVVALTGDAAAEAEPGSPENGGGSLPSDPDAPRQLAGPPVYVGDELAWFVPEEAELRSLFAQAGTVTLGSSLPIVGEGEGIGPANEACYPWYMSDTSAVIGARSAGWDVPSLGEYNSGVYRALQFPSGDQAAEYFAGFAGSADACASFEMIDYDGSSVGSQTLSVSARSDTAIVVEQSSSDLWFGDLSRALLLEGNVVVEVITARDVGAAVDGERLLATLTDSAAAARSALTEKIGYR